jgi:hypothetical protein
MLAAIVAALVVLVWPDPEEDGEPEPEPDPLPELPPDPLPELPPDPLPELPPDPLPELPPDPPPEPREPPEPPEPDWLGVVVGRGVVVDDVVDAGCRGGVVRPAVVVVVVVVVVVDVGVGWKVTNRVAVWTLFTLAEVAAPDVDEPDDDELEVGV